MDSFFEPTNCCETFPDKHGFCWDYDANYCKTCNRWLEGPYEHLPRPDRHICCDNSYCTPRPTHCICSHDSKDHRKSFLLRDLMGLSEEDTTTFLERFASGPHNCDKCDCKSWTPDPEGPTD